MESPVTAKAALLLALVDGEGYALELIERVRGRTGGKTRLLQGSVYPALRALERDGMVNGRWGAPIAKRGGRRRRYYLLTAEGLRLAKGQAQALLGLIGSERPRALSS